VTEFIGENNFLFLMQFSVWCRFYSARCSHPSCNGEVWLNIKPLVGMAFNIWAFCDDMSARLGARVAHQQTLLNSVCFGTCS